MRDDSSVAKVISPERKKTIAKSIMWGIVNARRTSLQLKGSSVALVSPSSSFNLLVTYRLSSWLKNRAVSGERGNIRYNAKPKPTVNRPSMMNIQRQGAMIVGSLGEENLEEVVGHLICTIP